ncbi:MAG: DNA polymerase III subunit delta [Leptospiraceae bacterium]|nr:DNA polymerase III subunit delta [Leptospiraceae bacterium]
MAVKQVKKSNILEFKNYSELKTKTLLELPKILFYVALDSFEFDLTTDYYRVLLQKSGEPFEVVVYVAEPGDLERFFSELFNLSMFSSQKLVIIKSGTEFFKPILLQSNKEMFENFKRNIHSISEDIFVMIHYDNKDLPTKLSSMFNDTFSIIKSKTVYPSERKALLEEILKQEKLHLDEDAKEEFINRIQPSSGAYAKSILKLKSIYEKKQFSLKEVEEVLFPSSEFNPFEMSEAVFTRDKTGFRNEFYKLKRTKEDTGPFLTVLSSLLSKADEVRKASILFNVTKDDEKEFFKQMGMDYYTDGRKRFTKIRLKKEVQLFHKETLDYLYDTLLELNILVKTSSSKDELYDYFFSRIEVLFLKMES